MPPRSYIEAMDRPTILYNTIYYGECSTDEPFAYNNASRNDAIFAQKVFWIYATTSQYLSFYGCAITMLYYYTNIYIFVYYIIVSGGFLVASILYYVYVYMCNVSYHEAPCHSDIQ